MNTLYRKCFPLDPVVRELGKQEILLRSLPVRYWCEIRNPFPIWSPLTGRFTVPGRTPKGPGFLSDGASVPDFAYWLVSDTHPDVLWPAYGHDFLFANSGAFTNDDGIIIRLSLHQCNECIDYWMKAVGASEFRRRIVMTGLHIGSWACWHAPQPPAKLASAQPY